MNLNDRLGEKNTLQKTYNGNSAALKDIDQQILQIKNAALDNIESTRERINKSI